jgi:hypothetical protein
MLHRLYSSLSRAAWITSRHLRIYASMSLLNSAASVSVPFFIKPYRRDQTAGIAGLSLLCRDAR